MLKFNTQKIISDIEQKNLADLEEKRVRELKEKKINEMQEAQRRKNLPELEIKESDIQIPKKEIPTLKVGDNIKVGVKIIEGNKERVQFYEGTIIAKKK